MTEGTNNILIGKETYNRPQRFTQNQGGFSYE